MLVLHHLRIVWSFSMATFYLSYLLNANQFVSRIHFWNICTSARRLYELLSFTKRHRRSIVQIYGIIKNLSVHNFNESHLFGLFIDLNHLGIFRQFKLGIFSYWRSHIRVSRIFTIFKDVRGNKN